MIAPVRVTWSTADALAVDIEFAFAANVKTPTTVARPGARSETQEESNDDESKGRVEAVKA